MSALQEGENELPLRRGKKKKKKKMEKRIACSRQIKPYIYRGSSGNLFLRNYSGRINVSRRREDGGLSINHMHGLYYTRLISRHKRLKELEGRGD